MNRLTGIGKETPGARLCGGRSLGVSRCSSVGLRPDWGYAIMEVFIGVPFCEPRLGALAPSPRQFLGRLGLATGEIQWHYRSSGTRMQGLWTRISPATRN